MHRYICPDCGAYLDPGERCDCKKEEEARAKRQEEQQERWKELVVDEMDGQMRIAV